MSLFYLNKNTIKATIKATVYYLKRYLISMYAYINNFDDKGIIINYLVHFISWL